MKKYVRSNNSLVLVTVEGENVEIKSTRSEYLGIDWSWVITEDGILEENGITYDLKKDDIVLCLYTRHKGEDDRTIIVIKSPELVEAIRKEQEWENRQSKCEPCECCCNKVCAEPQTNA